MSNILDLSIPAGSHGNDLVELLYRFGNALPLVNERRDVLERQIGVQEILVESLQARAYTGIDGTINDKKNGSLHLEVNIDGVNTTVIDEKKKLNDIRYQYNRAKSRVKEIEKLIDICRSCLSYDKAEGGNYNG